VSTVRRVVALAISLSCSGCFSLMGDAQAGAVSSTRFVDGRYGVAGQVAGGFNFGSDTDAEHAGLGADARLKVTGDVQQVGVGPHVYLLFGSFATPYARVGATLLEAGSVDGAASFGALGPRGELGVFLGPLVLSTFAEWDLRWTRQRNEGFVGAMIGVGTAVSTAPFH